MLSRLKRLCRSACHKDVVRYRYFDQPGPGFPSKLLSMKQRFLARFRSGFSTKLPAVVDALGNCLQSRLTPGQQADSPQLPDLLQALPEASWAVVADKAYETSKVLEAIAKRNAEPVQQALWVLTRRHPGWGF